MRSSSIWMQKDFWRVREILLYTFSIIWFLFKEEMGHQHWLFDWVMAERKCLFPWATSSQVKLKYCPLAWSSAVVSKLFWCFLTPTNFCFRCHTKCILSSPSSNNTIKHFCSICPVNKMKLVKTQRLCQTIVFASVFSNCALSCISLFTWLFHIISTKPRNAPWLILSFFSMVTFSCQTKTLGQK